MINNITPSAVATVSAAASSEDLAVDDSLVPDTTAHTPDAKVNDQVSQSPPTDPDQAAPGYGDSGAPEITAANSIQTNAQARRDSAASLAHLFGRVDLGSGPRFSVMTKPLTPDIYVQGPFSDPVKRASFALSVSEGLQNDQQSGDTADNLPTPPAASQYAGPTRLQGMPHTPSRPRYDAPVAWLNSPRGIRDLALAALVVVVTILPGGQPAVRRLLHERVLEAEANGLAGDHLSRLRAMLHRYVDVFRIEFGRDPPFKVPPLEARVRPSESPAKCSARRYPRTHQRFMEDHMADLEAAGLVYLNTGSRWATPPRIVPKKDGSYRMTVDLRSVNSRTEHLQWPMPQLEVALGFLTGSRFYLALDWFCGYWQLPLAPGSQELFTVMTHRGMMTPTRVTMGGSDSVGYCQSCVELIFKDVLYHSLLDILDRVLQACASSGLKLHPNKCSFFLTRAKWCGKIISADGISHCPDRVKGLVELSTPTTAAQLQKFLCCANWVRSSVPHFSGLVAPLTQLLAVASKSVSSRQQRKLDKDALISMVSLSHPDNESLVYLFADASLEFWGPLFYGAASRWPIPEKGVFAIVESCKRLEYFLLRPRGFVICTDHRNLVYNFDPLATDGAMQRHQADRLQRWAMVMTSYNYSILHIPALLAYLHWSQCLHCRLLILFGPRSVRLLTFSVITCHRQPA
ncbi:hypothetical protein H310_12834 [Aphanomyces invadans]|uniref:Reverse transcriptase RNase H-like domain-containing protein n=1 Tax=Aphanomyces invadans TaxID=157072 RepID=A0A024THD5_9STRA|nr:hypothetical protein H310_12834 [Aphanomyces invadans]ETV92996.1 hypothetical protein H310_12834 [Aphanomyces invadans]|eukprot:XP_008878261.1 hypothetical protein H310_12834 [Aphanomyces invadans]